MNNIHGTPNRGGGGSDRPQIVKPIRSSMLAIVCSVALAAVVGWYLIELCLWLITR